jgi:monoamine oxidase
VTDTTIVIGSGAAGLAAARRLHDAGQSVTVLEARDRVGGRAWTSYDFAPHPVELGAEFLHGENIVTWEYVRQFGLSTTDQATVMNVFGYAGGRFVEHNEFVRSTAMALALGTHAAAEAAESDTHVSIAEAARRWADALGMKPTEDDWSIWRSFVCQYFAADPEQLGTAHFTEPTFDGDGVRLQYRLIEGYTTLMDRIADGLNIRLNTPASKIEWDNDGVRVETSAASFEGRWCIVALPLAVLQQTPELFAPALPEDKRHAIATIGAGANGKIILRFDEMVWPKDMTLLLSGGDTQLWWRPGRLREDEAPVITAFFGGSAVERFRALGADAPVAALRQLEHTFGTKLESRLIDARFIDWPADPWARMSYSYLPPNAGGQRAVLAQPVDDVLFFAGEASHPVRPSTVHGAIETGHRAAAEVMATSGARA